MAGMMHRADIRVVACSILFIDSNQWESQYFEVEQIEPMGEQANGDQEAGVGVGEWSG